MENINLTKYSVLCLKTIKENITYTSEEFKHELLTLLEEIYKMAQNNKACKVCENKLLKKIHSKKNYPLVYIHYIESFESFESPKPEEKKLSYEEFYDYYSRNNLELESILDKPSRILEVINSTVEERQLLHEGLYKNPFVSLDIQLDYETNNLFYKKIEHNSHNIYLYEIAEDSINLDLVIFIINFMESLAQKFNIKYNPIKLLLFMSSEKKLKSKLDFLGANNINSGSTYYNMRVFLWRKEEVYKVLVHELLHYFGFDRKLFEKILKINHTNKYCIEGEDRESEAYTESFALIIHTYIVSKLLNMSFFYLINHEINFSIFQCKKIMAFFNITDINSILESNKCSNPIVQTTSVFSYFFLKTALLLNLKSLMDYIINNNHDNFNKLKEESFNEKYVNIINKANIYNSSELHEFVENTLRMTCLEVS